MAELQVFACSGRIVLCPHGVLHALNILFEVVERAKDALHALAVIHEGTGRVGLHIAGTFGLLGGTDGQWLDDLTRWALRGVSYMSKMGILTRNIAQLYNPY